MNARADDRLDVLLIDWAVPDYQYARFTAV